MEARMVAIPASHSNCLGHVPPHMLGMVFQAVQVQAAGQLHANDRRSRRIGFQHPCLVHVDRNFLHFVLTYNTEVRGRACSDGPTY